MDFSLLIGRDLTVHTDNHKYRGFLQDVLTSGDMSVLAFDMGVDDFYIDAKKVVAVTVHGREMER